MIVELFGLPGSGKSYIANGLIAELKERNIRAVNMTEYMNNTFVGKVEKKLLLYGIQLGVFEKSRKKIIDMLPQHKTWVSMYGIYESANYPINMIVLNLLVQKQKTDNVIYIYDEGVVHSIVKMMADFELDNSVTKALIECVIKTISSSGGIVIYNMATVETCIQSIKTRNRHVCVFDELSTEKLYKILNNYKSYCDKIADDQTVMRIDRNDKMKDNLEQVILKILEKKG